MFHIPALMARSGISQIQFLAGIEVGQLFFVSMSCNVDIRMGLPWSVMMPVPLNGGGNFSLITQASRTLLTSIRTPGNGGHGVQYHEGKQVLNMPFYSWIHILKKVTCKTQAMWLIWHESTADFALRVLIQNFWLYWDSTSRFSPAKLITGSGMWTWGCYVLT